MSKKLRFIPLFVFAVSLLTGCNLEAKPDGTTLMTALNYDENQRLIYSQDEAYTTPNGKKTIVKGDYKPVWQYIQNKIGVTLLEHQAAANSGEKKSVAYFRDNWLNKPFADISMGTVNAITKYSVAGNSETILDLKPYIDKVKINDDGSIDQSTVDKYSLPNIAKFLHENPGVKMSIMTAKHSHPEQAAIYYIPYLDGFDDSERMMNVRADYIEIVFNEHKKDDGSDDPTKYVADEKALRRNKNGEARGKGTYETAYTPFEADENGIIPELKYSVPNVSEKDGKLIDEEHPTIEITKKATKNIIYLQNELIKEKDGKVTTEELVNQFKDYFNKRYGEVPGKEGSKFARYSDLFLGYKACYEPDELIALMRIIKSAPKTIFGEKIDGKDNDREIITWYPTEFTNMRSSDLYRWGGQVFGVRGPESRTGYLYFNGVNKYEGFKDVDKVHDCRGDKSMFHLLEILRSLYKEGLLMQEFDNQAAAGPNRKEFAKELILNNGNADYSGFMEYGYVDAASKLNETEKNPEDPDSRYTAEGTNYRPMIGALSNWDTDNDGTPDTHMQFTESWNSVKTSAPCLNADLVNTPLKLEKALQFVDFIFSGEGRAVYNFGPSDDGYYYPGTFDPITRDFIPDAANPDKKVEYKGAILPQYTEEALKQMKNYDGYNRRYLGATLPMGFEKLKGADFQAMNEKSRQGVMRINKALELKTYRHACIRDVYDEYKDLKEKFEKEGTPEKKGFYKIIPSSFFLTDGQNTAISAILDKSKLGSIYTDNTNTQFSIWDDYVMLKQPKGAPEFDKYLDTVNGSWQCPQLVSYYQDAYELMV